MFVFSELVGWWAGGEWAGEWGLEFSGTVGQCGSGGWGIVAHEGDVAYNDDRQYKSGSRSPV